MKNTDDIRAVRAIQTMQLAMEGGWDHGDWTNAGMSDWDYRVGEWADLVYAPVNQDSACPTVVSGEIVSGQSLESEHVTPNKTTNCTGCVHYKKALRLCSLDDYATIWRHRTDECPLENDADE